MSNKTFKPNWNIKPGETITENLEYFGLTTATAAPLLEVTEENLIEVITAVKPITPPLAENLSILTGTSAKFWLNLEANYQSRIEATEVAK